ncbi:MAG: radical SAM protein [Myxococcota bacterium]|jgi:cyclic pyranopterin phosphate synthase
MASNTCNNRCLFCLEDRNVRRQADFSSQMEALEAYRWRDAVLFTCGEPTLNPALPGMVERARELGYSEIGVVTNGRRFSYPAYCRELAAAGLTSVTVSVHGDSSSVHDPLTRSPGSFAQTMDGLVNLLAVAPRGGALRVTTSTVITTRNLDRAGMIVPMLAKLGVRRMVLNYVEPESEALRHFKSLVPGMAEAGRVLGALTPPAGVELRIEGLPLCVIPGAGVPAGSREIIYLMRGGRVQRLRATRRQAKGGACAACAVRGSCDGVWIEYARVHGWGEFAPVGNMHR